jgi:hypothetical protein
MYPPRGYGQEDYCKIARMHVEITKKFGFVKPRGAAGGIPNIDTNLFDGGHGACREGARP